MDYYFLLGLVSVRHFRQIYVFRFPFSAFRSPLPQLALVTTALLSTPQMRPKRPVKALMRSTLPSTISDITATARCWNGNPCRQRIMSEKSEIIGLISADWLRSVTNIVIVPILFSIRVFAFGLDLQ